MKTVNLTPVKRTTKNRSYRAKAVAQEVLATIGKGKPVRIGEIAVKHGYKPTTAGSGLVQRTKSYQETIYPVIQSLEIERERAIKLMSKRISKARYRDLIDGMDKLTKNIQLLTGKSTSNISMHMRTLKDAELERIAAGSEAGTSEA